LVLLRARRQGGRPFFGGETVLSGDSIGHLSEGQKKSGCEKRKRTVREVGGLVEKKVRTRGKNELLVKDVEGSE